MNVEVNIRLPICRTCLNVSKSPHNIFHSHKNKQISDMLMEFTTIKVEQNDALPTNICTDCLDKLNATWDFRALIIASDYKLHNFSSNNKEQMSTLDTHDIFIKEETIVQSEEFSDDGDGNKKQNSEQIQTFCDNDRNNTENSDRREKDVLFKSGKIKDVNINILEKNQIDNVVNVIKDETMEKEKITIESRDESGLEGDGSSRDMLDDQYEDSLSVGDEENGTNNKVEGQNSENCESTSANKNLKDQDIEWELAVDPVPAEYEELNATLSRDEKRRAKLHCKLCKKTYSFYYYMYTHLPQHTGQLPYKCEICNIGFPLPHNLTVHNKKHLDIRSFSCDQCSKVFKYRSSLVMHQNLHKDRPWFKCHLCPKSFRQHIGLRSHLQRHEGVHLCVCDECGKTFTSNTGLQNHKLIHNAVVFDCATCGKSYKSKNTLRHHRILHRNLRPYECDKCDKTFVDLVALKNHTLTHTGEEPEKPHSCKVCDRKFRHKSTLKQHVRLHTGETPYACQKCPMEFTYRRHLRDHVKTHE